MRSINLTLLGDSIQPQEYRIKEALKISRDVKPAIVLDVVKGMYEGTDEGSKLNYAQLSRWREGLALHRSPPPESAVDQYSDLFSPLYRLLEDPMIAAPIDITEFRQRLEIQIREREQRLIEARGVEAERILQGAEERDHRKFTEEFNKIMDKLRELKKT